MLAPHCLPLSPFRNPLPLHTVKGHLILAAAAVLQALHISSLAQCHNSVLIPLSAA